MDARTRRVYARTVLYSSALIGPTTEDTGPIPGKRSFAFSTAANTARSAARNWFLHAIPYLLAALQNELSLQPTQVRCKPRSPSRLFAGQSRSGVGWNVIENDVCLIRTED
jgi:hypothetical protein